MGCWPECLKTGVGFFYNFAKTHAAVIVLLSIKSIYCNIFTGGYESC